MKKRNIDMDVNDYYNTMSGRTKEDLWDMPKYNTPYYTPITGVGRPSTTKTNQFDRTLNVNEYYANMGNRTQEELWKKPRYNDDYNKPIKGRARPAVNKTGNFSSKNWKDAQGKAIVSEVKGNHIYRPQVKKSSGDFKTNTGREEKVIGLGEERKVYLNNRFGIQISGTGNPEIDTIVGSFRSISGLESEWEVEEYNEGGDNGGAHFFPSKTKNSRLVLETGVGTLSPLLAWHMLTMTGSIIKGYLLINLLSPTTGVPVKMWMVVNAFPIRYVAPEFNALSSEVAIERVEFMHNGIITI